LILDTLTRTQGMNINAIRTALETQGCTLELRRLERCRSAQERRNTLLGIRHMLDARQDEAEQHGQLTRASQLGEVDMLIAREMIR
jgi:hypothetical protein